MWRFLETERLVLCVLYRHLGPLGVFCRLTCQYPINSILHGQRLILKYSRLGLSSILNMTMAAIHLGSLAMSIWILSKEGHLKNIFVLYNIFLVLSQLVLLQTGWEDVCDLEDKFSMFDYLIYRVPVVAKLEPSYKGFLWLSIPVLETLHKCVILFIIWRKNKSYYLMQLISQILFCTPVSMHTMLFLMYCSRLRWRITLLQKSWIAYLKMATANNNGKFTLRLDHYRHLQTRLLGCLDSLNMAFGRKLISTCLLLFTKIVFVGYIINTTQSLWVFILEDVWFAVLIIMVGLWSSSLTYQGRLMLKDLCDIKISGLNHCLRSQMDLLMYQSHTTKAEVKIPGLFNFSSGLVSSFTCSVVTYFILATQLAPHTPTPTTNSTLTG